MPAPPPQGGAGQSWFVLDFEANYAGTPPPQGGLGQSWFVLDFEAAYAGEGQPQTAIKSGGGQGFVAGPIGQRLSQKIPVELLLVRPVEARLPVESTLVRGITTRLAVDSVTLSQFEARVTLTREPANLYATILAEDEFPLSALLGAKPSRMG